MVKVFISGTYLDLVEYRAAVSEQLRKMGVVDEVTMTYFGSIDKEPTVASLEKLEGCQIYLGIFGHRYGHVPEGTDFSVTHQEYLRAYELLTAKKMRLLIYMADPEKIPLLPKLIEPDWKRARQEKLRALLASHHVVQQFDTPFTLAGWVAAQIPKVIKEITANSFPEHPGIKVFDANDLDLLTSDFDPPTQERMQRIEDTLRAVAENFTSLFSIDSSQLEIHPLFRNIRDRVEQIIPGISLNLEDGTLKRTGVRHVVLRKDSFLALIRRLSVEQRFNAGREIGIGAATDLINNTLKKNSWVPVSPEAFVHLWDFWDSTGGWGKLSLKEHNANEEVHAATRETHEPVWFIQIDNNFLSTNDLKETHDLSNFWCGYIFGFLDTALPQLTDLMRDLDEKQGEKVALPPYLRVESVIHLDDSDLNSDVFKIRFSREKYSETLEILRKGNGFLREGDYLTSMILTVHALKSMKRVDEGRFETAVASLEYDARETVRQILKGERSASLERADSWFKLTNQLVKQLEAKS
jgi:hypothetical protein